MKEQYAYVQTGEEITLVRCWGEPSLVLPDTIHGLPVTALADHIFAPEASRRYRPGQIRYASPDSALGDEDAPLSGEAAAGAVTQIVLPRYLREIGSYAFYGCRSLKRIVFPDTLQRLGSGIFTACNHIEELRFLVSLPETKLVCLREILGEIDYEVLVTAAAAEEESAVGEKEVLRLLFPGYYEDSIENTPARIIEVKFEGTGYKYRQCFRGGKIDIPAYDRLFYLASVQENPSTAVKLALARLLVPARLETAAAADYLQYLRTERACCADCVIASSDRIRLLAMLCRRKYFDRELLDYWEARMITVKDRQALSMLADFRRKEFPVQKKQYVF